MTIITTVKTHYGGRRNFWEFLLKCAGAMEKIYGWHDMKNPGGSNSPIPIGAVFQPHLILKQKSRRPLLNVYFGMILRFAGLSYKI